MKQNVRERVAKLREIMKENGVAYYYITTADYHASEYADDFFILNYSFSQAIYARMEMGIHYEGWTLDRMYSYMSRYYSLTKNEARSIYRQLVELPGNAFAYAFAYLKILDIRDYALERGASLYDFHKFYLDHGNVPQQVIEENFKEQYK